MMEETLVGLCADQAEVIAESAPSWRPGDARAASLIHALESAVRGMASLPALLRKECDSVWDRATEGDLEGLAEKVGELERILEKLHQAVRSVGQAAAVASGLGYDVKGSEALARVEKELAALRAELVHAPRFTRQDIEDAKAEQARGELLDVDEAFAQIWGVSREEALRRLEEHNKKRKALGWE